MLRKVLFLIMAPMAAMSLRAQDAQEPLTAYVGLSAAPSGSVVSGTQGRVVSIAIGSTATVSGEYCVFEQQPGYNGMGEDTYVKSGAAVGNCYYAFVLSDSDTYSYFASLNFETGTITKIADTRADYNTSVLDMTYDELTGALYAIRTETQLTGTTNTVVYMVGLNDGSLTPYCTIEGVTLSAIAADGQGTIYGVESVRSGGSFPNYTYNVTLYAIDAQAKTWRQVRAVGTPGATVNRNTMAYHNGTLYYLYGRNMIVMTPQGEGFTEVEMPIRSGLAGLTFSKSTQDADAGSQGSDQDEDAGLRATSVETYGDAMGQFGSDVVTKRTVTIYDQWNNPVRSIQYGRMVQEIEDAEPWQVMYYTKYEYNQEHLLVAKHSEIIQEYVRGEYYYKSNNDTVTYEYDANGRLSRESTLASGVFTTYTYDENGQLTQAVTSTPDRFGRNGGEPLLTTVTYSEFAGHNMPRLVTTVSPYSSTWVVNSYENGHKTSAYTYNDAQMIEPVSVERWTWRADSLVEYANNWVNSDGTEESNKRTVYDCVDGNPYSVREASYYYSSGKWRPDGLPKVTHYTQLNSMYAPTALTITPVDGEINTSTVAFAAPDFPVAGGEVSFDIYRHGILVGNVAMTDQGAYDAETGMLQVVDRNVPNGTYDYVVQTVVKDELTGESTAYNGSEGQTVTYHVPLPVATNVHGEMRISSAEADTVMVAWQAPKGLSDQLRFEYYNVFVVGVGQANANDNGQTPIYDTSYPVIFARGTQDIYVQSVYHYGRANSDTVSIDMYQLATDGIDGVSESVALGKLTLSGCQIYTSGVAESITIYNASGAVVRRATAATSIGLATLPKGVYVALVNMEGKRIALKFNR